MRFVEVKAGAVEGYRLQPTFCFASLKAGAVCYKHITRAHTHSSLATRQFTNTSEHFQTLTAPTHHNTKVANASGATAARAPDDVKSRHGNVHLSLYALRLLCLNKNSSATTAVLLPPSAAASTTPFSTEDDPLAAAPPPPSPAMAKARTPRREGGDVAKLYPVAAWASNQSASARKHTAS